ncbi:hypothetical protein MMC30_003702 [Trapelia coarctata]|nr:hypothetical protein [Trapelia coarctata]
MFARNRGLEAQISFLQPQQVRKKSVSEQQRWWDDTKRLQEGSLLAFSPSKVVLTTDPRERYGLASGGHLATISANLASGRGQRQLDSLIELSLHQNAQIVLVEFPGVLPATFVPILESLQQMQKASRLPFGNWILPDSAAGPNANARAPAPLYARRTGFKFDLKPILRSSIDTLRLDPRLENHDMPGKLEQLTPLDRGQCEALVAALSREFVLIQGPPGTGKSYLGIQIMRVLIASKGLALSGPILVVCYTNHALDQFLEHLIAVGIEKIIPIGSNSSSRILEGKNLRLVSETEDKTRSERYILGSSYGELEQQEYAVNTKLRVLRGLQKKHWSSFNAHLRHMYPDIHSQFSTIDSDGFALAGDFKLFELWVAGKGENLLRLDKPSGRISNILSTAKTNIYRLAITGRTARRALATADVIGVTTSGLAKRMSVLRHINAQVVVCEEAGEVLKAHVLSALIPSVQHLIQIGDHQQLRPQINNYELSLESHQGRQYQLDRSQFERLSVREPGKHPFPVTQLDVQRRMRPQISNLIRGTLYRRLIDHDNVKNLPDVVGMRKNVFWYDHSNLEDSSPPEVRHIVRQGVYDSKDIAVLTPYAGQLQKLRHAMRNDFEIVLSERDEEKLAKDGFIDDNQLPTDPDQTAGPCVEKKPMSELLRIATVDNFQGEEAKIVVISLVRSNKEKKAGFLKTTNRINVLLSRAQHGMYLIGNAGTYSSIPMWSKVLGMLRVDDAVGETFDVCCPRHPETEILVAMPEHFSLLSPEGGCREPCDR